MSQARIWRLARFAPMLLVPAWLGIAEAAPPAGKPIFIHVQGLAPLSIGLNGFMVGGYVTEGGAFYWMPTSGVTLVGGGSAYVSRDGKAIAGTMLDSNQKQQAAIWEGGRSWRLLGPLVPGAVAAMRNVPLLSYGAELALTDGKARIRRLSATGYDWIEAPLPVVASVTDQVGEPRYASLKGIMAAKRKPMETWSLADLGLSADDLGGGALTRVTDARPPEEKPPTERIENLPAPEAAAKIADWLAARKLI